MNLFERINHRFSRSNSPSTTPQNATRKPSDQRQLYSNPGVPAQDAVAPMTSLTDYECPDVWTANQNVELRQAPDSRSFNRVVTLSDEAYKNRTLGKETKTPLSSLYNVSSNDEDEDEEDDDQAGESDDDANQDCDGTPGQFSRRSLRIRRSQEKAKASLPADFADRIEIAPRLSDSIYREPSGTGRTLLTRDEAGVNDEGAMTFRESDSDEDNRLAQPNPPESGRSKLGDRRSTLQSDWTAVNGRTGLEPDQGRPGIQWSSEEPRSLEDLMPYFRANPPGTSYLIKAIAQRSGCRCALCGHESLLLFPVLESSVALAHWGSWTASTKTHGRSSHHSRHTNYAAITTEVHSNLVLFRQCRGWYEILNESFQPIPHLTTVEQIRRARPSTFLIRRDLRCLLAPPSLIIPSIKDARPSDNEPSQVTFPSDIIAVATSSDTLMNSTPEAVPAGTLMRFITYLPRCSVKRGRKMKELGLVLATPRSPDLPSSRKRANDNDLGSLTTRAYYIGLEDSTPAVFPPKFSISPVAGPENISGVHSLASILRKFRLPLSIKPIVLPDFAAANVGGSGDLRAQQRSSFYSSGLTCGLSAIPGITFGEQTFLRLESLRRSDLLIISPSSTPDRLYLVTPSMLPDHVFQIGESEDPAYVKLLENHRLQSINFLAVAHPKDSLSYLVRHMVDVTREPRDSYNNRRTKSTTTQPQLTYDDSCRVYDELDDIYFYIRHGYYPSKSRSSESALKPEFSRVMPKPLVDPSLGCAQGEAGTSSKKTPTDAAHHRSSGGLPKAEALLAASLSTPVHPSNLKTNLTNGVVKTPLPNYRSQPREQGI